MLRKHSRIMLAPGLLMALIVLAALAGCGTTAGGTGLYGSGSSTGSSTASSANSGNSSSASSGQTNCASATAAVCTRTVQVNGQSKQVLVNPSGRTLYYYTLDTSTSIACKDTLCLKYWTPLISSSATVGPISGLSGTFATMSRTEGMQVTYNGHPLYTFTGDVQPDDVKGEGFMNQWYVVTPDIAPASGGSNNNDYGY
jgi:predicted lipoprotein with Yx(FWY)xxD motif